MISSDEITDHYLTRIIEVSKIIRISSKHKIKHQEIMKGHLKNAEYLQDVYDGHTGHFTRHKFYSAPLTTIEQAIENLNIGDFDYC